VRVVAPGRWRPSFDWDEKGWEGAGRPPFGKKEPLGVAWDLFLGDSKQLHESVTKLRLEKGTQLINIIISCVPFSRPGDSEERLSNDPTHRPGRRGQLWSRKADLPPRSGAAFVRRDYGSA